MQHVEKDSHSTLFYALIVLMIVLAFLMIFGLVHLNSHRSLAGLGLTQSFFFS